MERLTVRGVTIDLPRVAEDVELTVLSTLSGGPGRVSGFSIKDLSMRALDLQDAELETGEIDSVRTESANMKRVSARRIHFNACNFGQLRWTGGKISHTWFDGCKFLGSHFDGVTLDNVVFTQCKLDYSAFLKVRASGPVLLSDCSLREIDFDRCYLPGVILDDCELSRARFGAGHYKGFDMRNNVLSSIVGACNLKSIVIDRYQLVQLAESIASDMNVRFGDEPRV